MHNLQAKPKTPQEERSHQFPVLLKGYIKIQISASARTEHLDSQTEGKWVMKEDPSGHVKTPRCWFRDGGGPSVSGWSYTTSSGFALPPFTPSALIETDSYRNEHSAPPSSPSHPPHSISNQHDDTGQRKNPITLTKTGAAQIQATCSLGNRCFSNSVWFEMRFSSALKCEWFSTFNDCKETIDLICATY